jgi:hydroxymethylbilane synthase
VKRPIRIGTRDSELARWQATTVQKQLSQQGVESELVLIKSQGDLDLQTPLYQLGITGVFTKTLDIALLSNKIDIAIHSMKDVPTALPRGIVQTAVLPRASHADILVPGKAGFNPDRPQTIATGSLRRKAQWLNRYPNDTVVGLRGNVNTRLQKLADSPWNGAVFARAGLERIDLLPENALTLDWMIPAPAQGAMVIVARDDDRASIEATRPLNHPPTALCTEAERSFLRELEGGCSAPIGAIATVKDVIIELEGVLLSLDGQQRLEIVRTAAAANAAELGVQCARELLAQGGKEIMEEIRRSN